MISNRRKRLVRQFSPVSDHWLHCVMSQTVAGSVSSMIANAYSILKEGFRESGRIICSLVMTIFWVTFFSVSDPGSDRFNLSHPSPARQRQRIRVANSFLADASVQGSCYLSSRFFFLFFWKREGEKGKLVSMLFASSSFNIKWQLLRQ